MTGAQIAVLVAAVLTSGLLAGLFYAFSCAVMPGVARADDATFVTATRATNEAILNGWFALTFVGAPLLSVVALVAFLPGGGHVTAAAWAGGAVLAHLATWAITARVHLPLNRAIADALDSVAAHAAVRMRVERRWRRWNNVRTLTSTAAFACLLLAVLTGGNAAL